MHSLQKLHAQSSKVLRVIFQNFVYNSTIAGIRNDPPTFVSKPQTASMIIHLTALSTTQKFILCSQYDKVTVLAHI